MARRGPSDTVKMFAQDAGQAGFELWTLLQKSFGPMEMWRMESRGVA
jgi:hypothetical protein